MNIPAISERTIRRDIETSGVTLTSQIQVNIPVVINLVISMLHVRISCPPISNQHQTTEASQAHPGSWWWLKADGCDITIGLRESTKLEWSGDVDLNDGSL